MKRFLILVLVFFIIISACAKKKEEKKSETQKEALKNVEVIKIKKGNLKDDIVILGEVESFLKVKISAEEPGKIERLFVDKGDELKQGDTIAYINRELLLNQLDAAIAKNSLNEQRYIRAEKLLLKQAIPKQTYDDAKYSFEASAANVKLLNTRINKTAPVSPIDGEVVQKYIEEGEYVGIGDPIIIIEKLNPVKAVFGIPESIIQSFSINKPADITFDALNGYRTKGVITYISPNLDKANKTYRAEIILNNDKKILRPGLIARIEVVKKYYKNAVIIPKSSIIKIDERFGVYTVENNTAKLKIVETGPVNKDVQVILKGLKAGEFLIVKGHRDVVGGEKVKVFKAGSSK